MNEEREDARESREFFSALGTMVLANITGLLRSDSTSEQRESVAHADLVRRLGYAPDEALIRVRRALPPKTPSPK